MAIPSQQPPSAKSKSKSKGKDKAPRRSKARSKVPTSLKSTRPPLLAASWAPAPSPTTASAKTAGGPPSSSSISARSTPSSKHTRALINTHHLLQKRLAHARARHDVDAAREIEAQLAAQGGLQSYQRASRTGQSAERGGDSSRVLVRWLEGELGSRKAALRNRREGALRRRGRQETHLQGHHDDDVDVDVDEDEDEDGDGDGGQATNPQEPAAGVHPLRILEIGALSTHNALNVAGVTHVRRIDLRSAEEGIEEVDFMHLPLPSGVGRGGSKRGERCDREQQRGGYDVLSLSLVLNYVPDPKQRGAMLKRTTLFFSPPLSPSPSHSKSRPIAQSQSQSQPTPAPATSTFLPCQGNRRMGETTDDDDKTEEASPHDVTQLPCLFLVLPSPCLHNSRYLTPQHLTAILNSLGYIHLHTKTTRKLHYSLWRFDGPRARDKWIKSGGDTVFKKREINPGGGRNNFCIVLDDDDWEP
ncbi:hypothetical protein CLAIMM_10506 [Cladophialophora immunda]|nr:hypothetical protein CLAIMM_10506 [Cladophialophora immunda]